MQPRFGLRGKNQPLGKEKQSDSLRKMSRGKSKLWPHSAWSNQRRYATDALSLRKSTVPKEPKLFWNLSEWVLH